MPCKRHRFNINTVVYYVILLLRLSILRRNTERYICIIFRYHCLMLILKFTDCSDIHLSDILALQEKMFRCKEQKPICQLPW